LLSFVLPKIEREASARNYGRFVIGPMESGYGITLGNALRRVLLSSLPGAAVTSVRVSGVHHEFSPIPNVREDTTALLLNIKQLRLKSELDEPVRLHVDVRSEGPVTAGDLVCPPEVEVVNPELACC
jgi:DNA-directed RNA polymerase subunit alpha